MRSSSIRISCTGALIIIGSAWALAGANAQTPGAARPVINAPTPAAQVVQVLPVASAGVSVPAAPAAPVAASAPPANAVLPEVGPVPNMKENRAPVVGATARHLLDAQASGRVAAPAQPMYGTTASLSWKRYVDSFAHPIPEFFESRVGKKASE